MPNKGWFSKTDVIQDLTIATGKRVCDFNEEYVIVGEKPPPLCHISDEEEDMQISRMYDGKEPSGTSDIGKPDLIGITQMIRMVNNFDETPTNVSRTNVDDKLETKVTNTMVCISKLNPNVSEFVPKNKSTNKLDITDLKCIKEDVIMKQDHTDVFEKEKKENLRLEQRENSISFNNIKETNKTDICESNSLGSIDISRLTPLQMQEMKEKLKMKIGGTSNAQCVQVKRERNLAIATLVKLHCQTTNPGDSSGDKPQLITPDYYQKSVSNHIRDCEIKELVNKRNNISDAGTENAIKKKPIVHKTLAPSVDNNTNQLSVKNTNETTSEFGLDFEKNKQPHPKATSPVKEDSIEITKEVKESIVKVENWLNSPSKKEEEKGPLLYIGPVTFKRKVNSKPISPVSTTSENSKVQKSLQESFVPSQFANQLSKKYMERSKARDATETDMWMKLELELKAKDNKIKKETQALSERLTN